MYSTTCPKCGAEGQMRVTSYFVDTSIPLAEDGFDTTFADFYDTSDELVECATCHSITYLELLRTENI